MSDTEPILPLHEGQASAMKSAPCFWWLEIPFPRLGWASITCSFFSFFFCVFWSIAYNFEEANATHCSVDNFLPSISAAIGHFYPQIYVWNTTILLQMYPRLKISTMYLHYYCSVIYDKYWNACHVAWALHVAELWSLLALSLVTSTANYSFHAFSFICFLFTSMTYMVLTCYLLKYKRKMASGISEARTLKWKLRCCTLNIFCFLMAGYFFRRHNVYCEPKVYSIFAFFEYGVVLTNILFHQFAIWDFHDRILTVALTSRGIRTNYEPPFKSALYALD